MSQSRGHLTESYGYLLSKLGQAATDEFAQRLKATGLRPKHCGLLFAISSMPASSQTAIAQRLQLVPSAVVSMIDDLEALNAIRRVPDEFDRRRYVVELTAAGNALLTKATAIAAQLDDSITGALTHEERNTLHRLLVKLSPRGAS
jgi:DNA-binding MarR family transcriptional regulator